MSRSPRFTLMNAFACIGLFLVLFTFTMAWAAKLDGERERTVCASHLRQIGLAIMQYSNDSRGPYPRTMFKADQADNPVAFTGVKAKDPFVDDGGPKANDVSAALYLLLRTEDITSAVFVCPSTDDVPDAFGGRINSALDHANFTSPKNLSYSYADPYPDTAALGSGYKMVQGMDAGFAILADKNPGTDDLTKLNILSEPDAMRKGNSPNHSGDGQNVLYADFHVEFQDNPFVGVSRDNIYTCGDSGVDPDTKKPRASGGTGIADSPVGPADSILLPTAKFEPPAEDQK